MHAQWTQGWWMWAIRGLVAVFFGVIALMYPAPSLLLALLLFSAYLQLDGLATFALASSLGLNERAVWPLAGAGLIGLIGGMLIMLWPDGSGRISGALLGGCCVLRGGLEAAHALHFRALLRRAAALALAGGLSFAFGLLVGVFPYAAASTLVFAFAAYVLGAGVCLMASAMRMRTADADPMTVNRQTNVWKG
jgi:uncharacterized membrane protein HdeD (DUF308 family)